MEWKIRFENPDNERIKILEISYSNIDVFKECYIDIIDFEIRPISKIDKYMSNIQFSCFLDEKYGFIKIKSEFFDASVISTTIIAEYDRG